jgi:hypothetical protein
VLRRRQIDVPQKSGELGQQPGYVGPLTIPSHQAVDSEAVAPMPLAA